MRSRPILRGATLLLAAGLIVAMVLAPLTAAAAIRIAVN